jgi:hypothetical protein
MSRVGTEIRLEKRAWTKREKVSTEGFSPETPLTKHRSIE